MNKLTHIAVLFVLLILTNWVWTRDLWLGGFYGYSVDHSFAGAMKDLRIYNRCLSADEIAVIGG